MQNKLEIKYIEPKEITKYARNTRTHDPAQISKIKASIKEFGMCTPIGLHNGTIVYGHARYDAMIQLDYTEMPTVDLSHLSATQVKAYVIADNRLALDADWNEDMLRIELDELGEDGFDLELTGFSLDEIEALQVEEVPEGLTDEDAVPEAPDEPVTVEGDVWVLGRHRLHCGDSTSIDAVEKLMDGKKADMVFTDPPYGINEKGDRSKRGGNSKIVGDMKGLKLQDFKDDTTQYAIDAYNLCDGLGIPRQVWWGANYYCHSLPQSNNWFIWDKRVEDKHKNTNSDCEMAWVKSEFSSIRIFRHLWNGICKGSEMGESRVHPTQKPVALAIWAFDYFKNVASVLDLFGGSGSALIACEKTNRNCYMMELSPVYCDVILNRFQNFSGKEAVLESTGETFNSKITV